MSIKEQVESTVIGFIAAFSGRKPSQVPPKTRILTDPPLSMDSTGLGYMTLSLRAYIKSKNDMQTISVTEVRKKSLTVQQLIDLVYAKVQTT